jgi:hypothetical protein
LRADDGQRKPVALRPVNRTGYSAGDNGCAQKHSSQGDLLHDILLFWKVIIFRRLTRRLMWINIRLSALAFAHSKNFQNGDSLKGKLDPAQIGLLPSPSVPYSRLVIEAALN